jgi:chitosanase
MRVGSSPPAAKPVAPPAPARASAHALAGEAKRRAEQLTSLFENSTTVLQYGYAENIHDGRGITAGRAGFTSGTDDLYAVVKAYCAKVPKSPLARFLPALAALTALPDDAKGRGSTKGLTGLVKAWEAAAADPVFRAVQDAAVDKTYFKPAEKRADALGLTTPLARAQLYDAIIQHGEGTDPDGLPALIQRATAQAGGTPKTGVSEARWLAAVLAVRREDLLRPADQATQKEWSESVDRVGVFEDLLSDGNLQLTGPITVHHGDFQGVVP